MKPYNAIEELTDRIRSFDTRLNQEGQSGGIPANAINATSVAKTTVASFAISPRAPSKTDSAVLVANKNLLKKEAEVKRAEEKEEVKEAEVKEEVKEASEEVPKTATSTIVLSTSQHQP